MRKTILLDGVWDFAFFENTPIEEISPQKIHYSEATSVPGCYDALKKYFGKHGTGVYFRKVECGGAIRLKIDAMGLRGRVFWDGSEKGYCEHAFSPEELFFHAGKHGFHELVIAVENIPHPRESGKMFVEDYDFHGYGGIYDSVTVTELPQFWINGIYTVPLNLDGDLKVKLSISGKIPDKYKIEIAFDDKKFGVKTISGASPEFVCRVPDCKVWSMESPNLHHIRITLDPANRTDSVETSFGIRTIEAKNSKIYLNGRAIRLVGYNRHDSHPELGYALPASLMLSDLQLIKEQGGNFIRGSHYPQREKFLALCDRMGILVWEEVLGWNNQPVQCRNPDFIRYEIEQAAGMVRKSMNHPSVIMWGFLNEVYMPKGESPRHLIKALADTIRREDPSRLVTFAFATGWIGNDDCLDLVDVLSFNTYPGWYGWWENPRPLDTVIPKLRELAKWASRKKLRSKPLIISEIGAAALYGYHDDCRWGEEYQEELLAIALNEIFDNPRFSGIAIWHFCDAKSHITTSSVLTRPRGFNNKGVLDEYRRPKQAWRRIRDILSERNFKGYLE